MRRPSAVALLVCIVLFEMSAFVLLAFANETFSVTAIIFGALMVALFIFQYALLSSTFPNIDRYILIIANMLAAIGMIVQYRLNPDIAMRQMLFIGIGMVAMIVVIIVYRKFSFWDKPKVTYLFMIVSLGLLALSLVFGRTVGGAKNWFNIAGFSFQPSELVKLLFVIVAAGVFSKKPRTVQLLPLFGFFGMTLILLVLQRDLGAAMLYAGTFLILLFVGTNKLWLVLASAAAAVGGAIGSYYMFDHVRIRVAIWKNPWADYSGNGYQLAQGLMAIASGGMLGMGLGLGIPKVIPAYHTDFIFAVICEEFGIIFGLAMVAFYVVFIVRGALIALNAKTRFDMLVAFGCTAMITLQSFIIIGGVIKLIPLTGITLPFVSYGGSSMLSCMILVGILQAIAIKNGDTDDELLESGEELPQIIRRRA